MFDKFTDSARKVMALAREEAQTLNHEYISTEHILLGILRLERGMALQMLKKLDIAPQRLRDEVIRLVQQGPPVIQFGNMPFTPKAKDVLKAAVLIASENGHSHIGTEHLLLALLRVDGAAQGAIQNLDITYDAMMRAFEEELSDRGASDDTKEITPEELIQLTNQVLVTARHLVERLEGLERKIEKVFPLPKPQPTPPPTSGHPNGAPINTQPPPNSGSFPVSSAPDNTTSVPCHACGQPMVRSGSCYKCLNCGETSGCS